MTLRGGDDGAARGFFGSESAGWFTDSGKVDVDVVGDATLRIDDGWLDGGATATPTWDLKPGPSPWTSKHLGCARQKEQKHV